MVKFVSKTCLLQYSESFSRAYEVFTSVALVVIHVNYCFGQIRLLSDRTIMGKGRYQTLSENTMHPTEHHYWSVFIVNNHI